MYKAFSNMGAKHSLNISLKYTSSQNISSHILKQKFCGFLGFYLFIYFNALFALILLASQRLYLSGFLSTSPNKLNWPSTWYRLKVEQYELLCHNPAICRNRSSEQNSLCFQTWTEKLTWKLLLHFKLL